MNIKKAITIGTMAVAMAAFAAPTVTDVTAKQRFPWNGLVDITCKVAGIDGAAGGSKFGVEAVMPDSGGVREVSHFWVVRNGTNSTDYAVSGNGSHHLLWNAQADLGAVIYSNMVVRVTLTSGTHSDTHDKVQLWEDGPYWATTNIGADEPWEYGYYFWWGDTVGYKRENDAWVATDGSSSNFSFNDGNVPTCKKTIDTLRSEGWITADGVLALAYDAAHVHRGGKWRMPTNEELSDLVNICDWTWTKTKGVYGYIVRGRGNYASNSIFLPCAGYGDETSLIFAGSRGYLCSSVPYSANYLSSWISAFDSGAPDTRSERRSHGWSVRPVQGFIE